MKIRTKLIAACSGLIVLTVLALGIFALQTAKKDIITVVQAKAKSDLATTWNFVNAKVPGAWRVEGNKLYKGNTLLNNNNALVDQISKMTGGGNTIFLENMRIATTVKLDDGSRAVGTPAAADVSQTVLSDGKEFYGEAIVVGKKIQTAYRPIKDANDKIIGMWFVGVPKDFVDALMLQNLLGIVGVGLVIVILGIALAYYIARNFEKPIIAMMKAMDEAEKGVLNIELKVDSKDEIGVLAKSFTSMLEKFRSLLADVQEAVLQVAATSTQLTSVAGTTAAAAHQVAAAMEEIAASNAEENATVAETADTTSQLELAIEQIANGAQEQARNVNQTSERVAQMDKAIEQVAQNTQVVAQAARETEEAAEVGGQAVSKTIEGMNRIKNTVYQSAQQIKELGERSEQIGDIVQVIDDIAAQTNLLALNAAIEAARAGEQGKGFAVVADEVRKLAERSAKATREIADLINTIRQVTGKAVEAMEQGTVDVEEGSALADGAGEALKQILVTIRTANAQIQSISKATREVSNYSNEVVEAVNNIAAITEENTASTEEMAAGSAEVTKSISRIAATVATSAATSEQVSASAEDMSNSAEEINSSTRDLTKMVEKLKQSISRFKI